MVKEKDSRGNGMMIVVIGTGTVACQGIVRSIFLYACESWTLTAELQRRIQAKEMRCCRKILRTSYKDHVTNEKSVPRSSRQSHHTKTS